MYEVLYRKGGGGILDEEGVNVESGESSSETGNAEGTGATVKQYTSVTTAGYMDVDLATVKRQRLFMYMEAEKAILLGAQSYTLDNRTLTRANLSEIRKVISDLIAEIALEESNKNGNTRRVMFID